MKIVILDGYTANPGDLDWRCLEKYGQVTAYDHTLPEEIIGRSAEADIVIANVIPFDHKTFDALPELKMLCLISTGYSHVDLESARAHGVAVTNAPGYSTEAVAQHTIALLLALTNHVALHHDSIVAGDYYGCPDDCYFLKPLTLLAGKKMCIVGMGSIGKKVASIAEALGMEVDSYRLRPEALTQADVVSLHCPLTEDNRQMVNAGFLSKMKDGALFLNTARGGLVDESALAEALASGKLSGAGLDVQGVEPPLREAPSPLMGAANCILTPHNAWMPVETRRRLIEVAEESLASYVAGGRKNRVD